MMNAIMIKRLMMMMMKMMMMMSNTLEVMTMIKIWEMIMMRT